MRDAKRCLLLVALFLTAIGVSAAQAASLRFIVFCDTLDPSIGAIKDLNKAKAWANTIASYTGLTLQLQAFSGGNVTPAKIRSVIEDLDSDSDDVIYFTYSGHGANPGDSPWPVFTVMASTDDEDVTFDEVASVLEGKPHRMLVIISDCCNASMDDESLVPRQMYGSVKSDLTEENFQKLFIDFEGTVYATASRPGQYSLGDEYDGGLFLCTYMDTLNGLASTEEDLTWETVLAETADNTTTKAQQYIDEDDMGIDAQEPYYSINGQANTDDTGTDSNKKTGICGTMSLGQLGVLFLGYAGLISGRKVRRSAKDGVRRP